MWDCSAPSTVDLSPNSSRCSLCQSSGLSSLNRSSTNISEAYPLAYEAVVLFHNPIVILSGADI